MTGNEFKSAMETRPFRPLRISFGSGQTLDITLPEMVALSPSLRTAVVYTKVGGFDQGDMFKIIDVMLIETIEPLSNGHSRSGGGHGGGPKRKR